MRTVRLIAIVSLQAVLLSGGALAEERLAVIVNSGRSVALSLEEIASIYLKKRRYWGGGDPILPVNREADSTERRAFTRRVFRQEPRYLEIYWNRQYFHGVLPPATLASDEAVKRYVAQEPNAVGYIRAALVDDSVRVVLYLNRP